MSKRLYATIYYAPGYQRSPMFIIEGHKLFTTEYHPMGYTGVPWYEIRESVIR